MLLYALGPKCSIKYFNEEIMLKIYTTRVQIMKPEPTGSEEALVCSLRMF